MSLRSRKRCKVLRLACLMPIRLSVCLGGCISSLYRSSARTCYETVISIKIRTLKLTYFARTWTSQSLCASDYGVWLKACVIKIWLLTLYVCPLAYLKIHMSKLYEMLPVACCLWPWLGYPLTTMQYVMYFRILDDDMFVAESIRRRYVIVWSSSPGGGTNRRPRRAQRGSLLTRLPYGAIVVNIPEFNKRLQ